MILRHTYFFGFALAYWYARKSIRLAHETKEREIALANEREKQARLELALLRAQVNPHLMYNILSNVHGMLLKESPQTAHIMLSLADLFTSTLTLSNPDHQHTLGDEPQMVQNSVELFSTIVKEPVQVHIRVPEVFHKLDFPAYTLLGIIENVYKHADLKVPKSPPSISILTEGIHLKLHVRNRIASQNVHHSSKHGLNSIKIGLDKYFPKRYTWTENIQHEHYTLNLDIQLYETP